MTLGMVAVVEEGDRDIHVFWKKLIFNMWLQLSGFY